MNIIAPSKTEKTPLIAVILGMHRSGTSLITNILSNAGFYIGEKADIIEGTHWNPDGYFERRSVVELNNLILNLCGGNWDSPPEEKDIVRIKIDPKIESLLKAYDSHDKSVIKDPRMCITFPVWEGALGKNARIINITRKPDAIAASLMKRDNFPLQKGLDLWHTYTERAFKYSKNYSTYHLRYEDFFSHHRREILNGLSDFLETNIDLEEIAKQVINPDLNHYKSDTKHSAFYHRHILPNKIIKYVNFVQNNKKKYEKAIRLVRRYEKYRTILKGTTKNDIPLDTFAKVIYYFKKHIVKNITRPFRKLRRKFNLSTIVQNFKSKEEEG